MVHLSKIFSTHLFNISQPYSRNNVTDNRDMNDPRSKSFLHLCQLLRQIKMKSTKCLKNEESYLPFFICMENVVGFEKVSSNSYLSVVCCRIMSSIIHTKSSLKKSKISFIMHFFIATENNAIFDLI